MNYAAMIIDIKDSRKLDNEKRQYFQKKIQVTINFLNDLLSESIKYKTVFSSGDSIQGLFKSINSALGYYDLFKALIYPLDIRCGIGYGKIDIDIDDFDSNYQDGPAYHNARTAIDLSKENSLDILIVGTKFDLYVNELFRVIKKLESGNNEKRQDIYNLVNLLHPFYIYSISRQNYYSKIKPYILGNITEYQVSDLDDLKEEDLAFDNRGFDESKHLLPPVTIPPSLALVIGNILGTTRENIRQMIEKIEVNQIYNLKLIIYKLIERTYL